MELISRSRLSAKRSAFERGQPYGSLRRFIDESKTRHSTTSEITVFLSHKHNETKELHDAIALLKSVKVNVYVDWIDEEMPITTSGETAKRLKNKIRSCQKFILLATENAINSKWCNWELGLGDAHKYIRNIALLVVKDDDRDFSGSEYLDIYPVIGQRYGFTDQYFDVVFPDGSSIDLVTWLNTQ